MTEHVFTGTGMDYAKAGLHDPRKTPDTTFAKELEALINKYSKESGSNTPDFILATYLNGCLETFDQTLKAREKWFKGPEEEIQPDPA